MTSRQETLEPRESLRVEMTCEGGQPTTWIIVKGGQESTQSPSSMKTDDSLKCWWTGIRTSNQHRPIRLSKFHLSLDLP